jgi:hypothetical protein
MLPCVQSCTYGKGFAVHSGAFAVQCAARQCLLFYRSRV